MSSNTFEESFIVYFIYTTHICPVHCETRPGEREGDRGRGREGGRKVSRVWIGWTNSLCPAAACTGDSQACDVTYRDGNGLFCIIAIHKEISVFTFSFNPI